MSVHSEIENPVGNAAAMREALNDIGNACALIAENCNNEQTAKYMWDLVEKVKSALASPARNCDMFNDRRSAFEYFMDNELWKYNSGLSAEYWFSEWLLAPAAERKGEAE